MRLGATLAAAALLAGCGGDGGPERRDDPFVAIEREFERSKPGARSAPRWEPVARLSGHRSLRRPVAIADGAIQWRVRWSCERGRIRVAALPGDSGEPDGGSCPGRGDAQFIGHGARQIEVEASGPWRAVVEQEVETPLAEPPLPQMAAAPPLRRGAFRSIEHDSGGTAALYRLRGGRLALRLDDFRTSANVELFVWIGRGPTPRTTRQALRAPHRQVAELKSTIGDQNYRLPRALRSRDADWVVIWCEPIRVAYAVAPLRASSRGSATNSS